MGVAALSFGYVEYGEWGQWPVTYSWDLYFEPQNLIVQAQLASFFTEEGNSMVFAGVSQYTTRNPDGADSPVDVGSGTPHGTVPAFADNQVDSVTTFWAMGAAGGSIVNNTAVIGYTYADIVFNFFTLD